MNNVNTSLIDALEIWWDAQETDHPATEELWQPILDAAVAHATKEGADDAHDGDATEYEPGADEAYLNAVLKSDILKGIGLDPSALDDLGYDQGDIWDLLVEPWCAAFEAARREAFGG